MNGKCGQREDRVLRRGLVVVGTHRRRCRRSACVSGDRFSRAATYVNAETNERSDVESSRDDEDAVSCSLVDTIAVLD